MQPFTPGILSNSPCLSCKRNSKLCGHASHREGAPLLARVFHRFRPVRLNIGEPRCAECELLGCNKTSTTISKGGRDTCGWRGRKLSAGEVSELKTINSVQRFLTDTTTEESSGLPWILQEGDRAASRTIVGSNQEKLQIPR
jgi:hypothetical protein